MNENEATKNNELRSASRLFFLCQSVRRFSSTKDTFGLCLLHICLMHGFGMQMGCNRGNIDQSVRVNPNTDDLARNQISSDLKIEGYGSSCT